MSYTSQNVTDELFVDGLQDATFQGGIEVSDIATEFNVDERDVRDWMVGDNLPPNGTQVDILNWLDGKLDQSD